MKKYPLLSTKISIAQWLLKTSKSEEANDWLIICSKTKESKQ